METPCQTYLQGYKQSQEQVDLIMSETSMKTTACVGSLKGNKLGTIFLWEASVQCLLRKKEN